VIKKSFGKLSQLCAYTHLFKVFLVLWNHQAMSEQTKAGRNIALLGLFCPFFWYALFTGASKEVVIMHATHSGIVLLIGIVIIFVSIRKQKE
jgi:hypothetical protein